jgi:ABC-2 type transport system ATP-binding protein
MMNMCSSIDMNMRSTHALEAVGLTKRYADRTALDSLTLAVPWGRVTALLGPNGAGKTTFLRMLLGLANPTSGSASVAGSHYRALTRPLQTVGASLEASGFHPGTTGRAALVVAALSARVPDAEARADELLERVGLAEAANLRVGGYSLGMRQRLGLARALVGDPQVLVLDEPANGLDPEGVRWLRELIVGAADEGRTVLVSSHALAEVALTAADVVVLDRGRLRYHGRLSGLRDGTDTLVLATDSSAARVALVAAGFSVRVEGDALRVLGALPEDVSRALPESVGIRSTEPVTRTLEDGFLSLLVRDERKVSA